MMSVKSCKKIKKSILANFQPFARRGATAATTASFVTFAIRVKRSDERRRATDVRCRHLEDHPRSRKCVPHL